VDQLPKFFSSACLVLHSTLVNHCASNQDCLFSETFQVLLRLSPFRLWSRQINGTIIIVLAVCFVMLRELLAQIIDVNWSARRRTHLQLFYSRLFGVDHNVLSLFVFLLECFTDAL
jgi:hypothetical protein